MNQVSYVPKDLLNFNLNQDWFVPKDTIKRFKNYPTKCFELARFAFNLEWLFDSLTLNNFITQYEWSRF